MNDREGQIIHLLNQYGELSVTELSHLLGISASSIRRSLMALGEGRFVERTRGGARLSTVIRYSPLPIYKLPVDPREQRAIASRAAQFIQRGDVIGLSGGRICTELALHIRLLEGIAVVTNAVNIAAELVALPGIRVMLTGGHLSPESLELVGQAIGLSLNGVRIHKFFLGTSGLSVEHGVTGHNEGEALAARTIMEHSDSTIVLADSRKFKKADFAQVASISAFKIVVTSEKTPQNVRTDFEKAGVQIIAAPLADEPPFHSSKTT